MGLNNVSIPTNPICSIKSKKMELKTMIKTIFDKPASLNQTVTECKQCMHGFLACFQIIITL